MGDNEEVRGEDSLGACTKGHAKHQHLLQGFCSLVLPSRSGNGSSVGAAYNPTWGRGHRNLVAQAFKKRLSHEAPHCGNKPRVCAVNFPCTDGLLSGKSITQPSPVNKYTEPRIQNTKHFLKSPPTTRLRRSCSKSARVVLF